MVKLIAEKQYIGTATVRFLSGPLAGEFLSLEDSVTGIGRDRQNGIMVSDPKVSRLHARIRLLDSSWTIENLAPKSFITVNQQRVQQDVLHHNDVVQLGEGSSFVFLLQSSPLPLAGTPSRLPQGISFASTFVAANEPVLIVSSNIHNDRQVHALKEDMQTFTIGRDPASAVPIDCSVVSEMHAQIIREEDKFVLVHPHPGRERTLYGLWYQGKRIRGNEHFRKQLEHGDIFRIGDEHGTFVTLRYDNGTTPLEAVPEMQPVPLKGKKLSIGRTPDNAIVLDHPQVSAHHAVLEKIESGYRIVDLESTNHVYVSGKPVDDDQVLRMGDEIRIGPYRLTYTGTELRPYDESSTIRITAQHLRKVSDNKKVLLNDISLVIPPRKFVALVGGSGAGKTTLLRALSGASPAQEGTILYNGENYYRNLAAFSTLLGYVPQDDIVHKDLTVERALYYAARLRLPNDFTREQILWRIGEVLEDVEMSEKRASLISQLSGGQRKRVSIALELLANPGVFFLDEPTSGLDPGLDRKMMSLLRRLADRGRTIVLVTHATNNINACDYVCFLAPGGRLAYFGPPDEAKTFFGKTDFAEIYSALEPSKEQPDIPRQAEARFLTSEDYQRYVSRPAREAQGQRNQGQRNQGQDKGTPSRKSRKTHKHIKRGNPWSQFFILSMRYLELLKNDRGNLLILLLQAPVVALFLVVMMRVQIGTGIFDADQVARCNTRILTQSGTLALPQARTSSQIDCSAVLTFLKDNPNGRAYAHKKGGQEQALQDFIATPTGGPAQRTLFVMAFAAVLFGCINGAREIVKEATIYKRERTVSLGILPYMCSKIVVLGLLCLFQSAMLVLVVEIGEPLHQGIFLNPVLEVYITLLLASLAGLMIGLAISAVAPNADRAMSFVPIVLLPQVIFAGTLIALSNNWPTQALGMLFPTRWAMTALGSSVGLHADKLGGDKLFGDDYTFHGTLFSTFSNTEALHRLLLCWIALGVIVVGLAIVTGAFLKLKDKRV